MTHSKHRNSNDNPSICIPRIDNDIAKWQISDVFRKLDIGTIKKIDLVVNHRTHTTKGFIHFKKWKNNERAQELKNRLNDGDTFKLVYEFPHYWKCCKSKFSLD